MSDNNLPEWIVDGKCENNGDHICNIGYGCDVCPYNYAEQHDHFIKNQEEEVSE